MKRLFFSIFWLYIFAATIISQQKFATIGNFVLENGDTVYNCRIGYRTFGELNKEKSNVILFPTWFGGTSEQLANLIGDGKSKLLDSTKYFIIAVDALGNGISTSPSNSLKQPNSQFPQFSMNDIVRTQYHLLKNELGIDRLYAAIGGSMGSMQVLELMVSYPDFVKKVIAYVPTPWSSSYDKLLWSIRDEFIVLAHKYGMREREIFKIINMFTQLVARTPDWYVKNNPSEKFTEVLKSFDKEALTYWSSYDYLYQLRTMLTHDISKKFNSKSELKNIVKSDLLLIISKQDHILHPSSAMELAKILYCKQLILDSECGHLAVNCNIDEIREEIEKFLNHTN